MALILAVAGASIHFVVQESSEERQEGLQSNLDKVWASFQREAHDLAADRNRWNNPVSQHSDGMAFFLIDSLRIIRWTSNDYVPDPRLLRVVESGQLISLPQATFLTGKWRLATDSVLVGIVMISRSYPVNNPYLASWYNPFLAGLRTAVISDAGAGAGLPFYINGREAFRAILPGAQITYSPLTDILFGLASLLFLVATIIHSVTWIRGGAMLRGLSVAIGSIVIIRSILLYTSWPGSQYSIFNPRLFAASWYNPSLGDLAINLLSLMLLCSLLFTSYFRVRKTSWRLPQGSQLPGCSLVFTLALFALLFPVVVLQTIFNNSLLSLDVTASLEWPGNRIIAFACIVLGGLCFFLIHHALFRWWDEASLPARTKGLSLLLGALLFAGINELSGQSYLATLVVGLSYFLILWRTGIAASLKRIAFATFLYWLVTAIAFSSVVGLTIRALEEKRTIADQFRFGVNFLIDRDPLAEYFLYDASNRLAGDPLIQARLINPFLGREIIKEKIRKVYLRGYFGRYESSIRLFDSNGVSLDGSGYASLDSILSLAAGETLSTEYENVVQLVSSSDEMLPRYRAIVAVVREGASLGAILIDLTLKRVVPEGILPGLLLDSRLYAPYLTRAFSYAMFSEGKVLLSSGDFNFLRDFDTSLLGNVQLYRHGIARGDYVHVGVEDINGRTFVVSAGGYSNLYLLTNIAFHFTVSLAILLLAWVTLGVVSIAQGLKLNYTARIQLLLSTAFFVPLIVASVATLSLLSSSSRDDLVAEYRMRVQSAAVRVADLFAENVDDKEQFENRLTEISGVLSQDITFFSADGRRVVSTEHLTFSSQIISNYLNPAVFSDIVLSQGQAGVVRESIGLLNYLSAYAPVYSPISGNLLGVISMPFFDSKSFLDRTRINAMANILVIFAGLFILSVLISYFVSKGLTFPLRVITQYLRGTSLTGKNRPIVWKSDDEIGLMAAEYNRMLSTLESNRAELERSNRDAAWREIAQQVAHEIRNPLTPMKLALQQLEVKRQAGDISEEILRRNIETILGQVNILDEIAGSFSSIARMPIPSLGPVQVTALLERVRDIHSGLGIGIVPGNSTSTLQVQADEDLMIRILSNLVINAIQSKVEGRKLAVTLSAIDFDSDVELLVTDNGRGIEPAIADRIFLPHFTTKRSGSGLGLAIVRQGIEQMHGTVGFRNNEGGGATFFIRLPKA